MTSQLTLSAAIQDVIDFHIACDQPVEDIPAFPNKSRVKLRHELISEEWKEYQKAEEEEDIVEIADAIGDLIYVLIGAALEYGIPLAKVWEEIQRSNMAKVDPVTGKVLKREDGKILKPEGWTPPNIAAALNYPNYSQFAVTRHAGQLYAGKPYPYHLIRVASVLEAHGFDDYHYQAAAWLHDVIEDTQTTYEEVRAKFGTVVASLVWAVTGIGSNRRERNASIYEKLKHAQDARILKCADRIANHAASMVDPRKDWEPDHAHCRMYYSEKEEFLAAMAGVPDGMLAVLHMQYAAMKQIILTEESSEK